MAVAASSMFSHIATEAAGAFCNPNRSNTGPATPPKEIAPIRRSILRFPIRWIFFAFLCLIEKGRTPIAAPIYNNPASWKGGRLSSSIFPIGVDAPNRTAESNAISMYCISHLNTFYACFPSDGGLRDYISDGNCLVHRSGFANPDRAGAGNAPSREVQC